MEPISREDRLAAELEGLKDLKRQSSILDFEAEGVAPESYKVSFAGKGIATVDSENEPQISDTHQIQIQMAYLYPKREPDLKWLTPIYHPNLSKSGFVDLKDIGLEWNPELSLEIICERLWDVIRLAYMDFPTATCLDAKEWYQQHLALKVPIDARQLRDRAMVSQSNIVQYNRRNQQKKPASKPNPGNANREVLYIGEEPMRIPAEPESPPVQTARPVRRPSPDDDILFLD